VFLFNKPKLYLADLIPDGYIDIHSHLLPGIDDGAGNIDDTVSLLQSLCGFGFSQFVTTPHVMAGVWNNTRGGIESTFADTRALLIENQLDMPFKAAAEYLMDDTFLKLLDNEPLLTLKDDYVLVEMSYLNPPLQLFDIIFQLQLKGYKPVLAHPERYIFYHAKQEQYARLKKAGCLFQINLLSLTGYYGKPVFEVAQKLLENGMIDFAGSDVHHQRHIDSFKNKVLLKKTEALATVLNNNSIFSI
jgi:protein-tyrosine phosphatase